MQKRNIQRGLTATLAAIILLLSAAACVADSDNDTTDYDAKLNRIDRLTTDNLIDLEVLNARFTQLEQANQRASDRIAALESENRELTHRISVLESAAPTTAGAADAGQPSGLGAAYDVTTPDAREPAPNFAECIAKATGANRAVSSATPGGEPVSRTERRNPALTRPSKDQ